MDLLAILALTTMGLAIVFAVWSKRRTEKKLDDDNASTSSLARDRPDPNFVPDESVTDPHRVT